jgi:hypothetical protein
MNPAELITILTNRVNANAAARGAAVSRGDVAAVAALDADTAATLESLELLQAA